VRHELRTYLEELSEKVDETVDLSVLDQDHLVFLDQVARLQRLRAVSRGGVKIYCIAWPMEKRCSRCYLLTG
jgi:DNA-binding IclR family transcriptional regulator